MRRSAPADGSNVGVMHMRRSVILGVLASLLVAALPGVAAAAPAQRFTEHAIAIDCALASDDGFIGAFVVDSSVFDSFGDLAFWAAPAGPESDEPTLVSIGATIVADDTSVTADFELIDPETGDPGGTAVLAMNLTPEGPPEAVNDQFRDGNRWVRIEGTTQAASVDGTITVPGAEPFDAAGCFASIQDLTHFTTNPSAFVERFDTIGIGCFWETGGGEVNLFASGDSFGAGSDIFVLEGAAEYAGFGDPTLTTTAFATAIDLVELPDGDTVVGTATAAATLEATGEVTRSKDGNGPNIAKFTSERLAVSGSLELSTPDGDQTLPMDDEHCFASSDHTSFHSVRPNGPKPGPLANDAPDGAIALGVGKVARIVTGANAEEPEEPCADLPITYTAWWTFVGTGNPMTADTAGSNFDTIVGVYDGSPGSLTEIACVDDVDDPAFSLQARVTVDTVAGVTYYVQAGGFGGSAGRLQLVVS